MVNYDRKNENYMTRSDKLFGLEGGSKDPSFIYKPIAALIVPFLAIMLFFPSITFSLLSAEIFPWAIVYSILRIRKFSLSLMLLLMILLISSMYVVLIKGNEHFPEALRSLSAYVNSILLFGVVLASQSRDINLLIRVSKYVAIGLVFLGIAQFLGLTSFLSPVIDFLMPRGSANMLGGQGARGVSLLSSEPSRAAYELIFIYLIYRFTLLKPAYRIWGDLIISLVVFFFIRSAAGAFLLVGFWLLFNRSKLLIVGLIMLVYFSFLNVNLSGRAFLVFSTLVDMSSLSEVYTYILNNSGFRLVSIVGALLFGIINPFGGGVGFWRISSVEAMSLTGVSPEAISYFLYSSGGTWSAVRPASYFGSLMLDVGIIGAAAFLVILLRLVRSYKTTSVHRSDLRNIVFFFFLYFFMTGAVGNPIPWLSLAVLIKFYSFKVCST